jgi:hypothetical protein
MKIFDKIPKNISNDDADSSNYRNNHKKLGELKSETSCNFMSGKLKLKNLNNKKENKETKKNLIKKENIEKKDKKEKKEKKERKVQEPEINCKDNELLKEINFKGAINYQDELKNNLISLIDYFQKKNKETKQTYKNNKDDIDDKYLLYREKIVLENKQLYSLQNQNNTKDYKNFIHVKINSKFNNIIFNKMSKIKKKELNIINIILNNRNKDPKKIIQEKLKQQKQIHILLNLIRDLIKIYGNISHLFDDDNNKKILIKSLFLRYNIREKEWNENDNLLDMYHKMINDINKEKLKKKNKEQLNNGIFKAIKEEEENENENEEEDINDKNKDKDKDKGKNMIIEEEESNEESEEKDKNKNIISKGDDDEKKQKENIDTQIDTHKDENEKNNIEEKNLNVMDKNKNNNLFEIKDNVLKDNNVLKNSIINLDENINNNNINNDLLNKNNIIINNFIINH